MTAKEIVDKWIAGVLPNDDAVIKDAIASIMAGLQEDIEDYGKAERQACAKLAESLDKSTHPADVADAIRARSTA